MGQGRRRLHRRGAGDDQLYGNVGNDRVFGDLGNDKLWGDENNDYLIGGDGIDYLYGGKGSDVLDGSLGYDYLYGEADYDYLQDDVGLKSDTGSNFTGTGYPFMGWLDRFLQDASLRTEARYAYAPDFAVSRTEMIDIFDAAEDGNTVDSTEFGDLQDIVGTIGLSMPEYVRSLADKVVNGDRANNWFQGSSLGNLHSGDSASHLDMLVDKWFLGKDRPVAQYEDSNGDTQTAAYQYVNGSLFQSGVSYTDISQGAVGDCYFLAALGSLALRNPAMIQSMFIDNGDGTFSVRFYKNATTVQYVTVDRYLPTFGEDRLFASFGNDKDDAINELWVALAEKAYAQLNESGWIGQNDKNSYQGIAYGWSADTMTHLTGLAAWQSPAIPDSIMNVPPEYLAMCLSFNQVLGKLNSGKLLTLSSEDHPADDTIVGNHAYTVVGYNTATAKFTVFNPWGLDRSSDSLTDHPAFHDLTWNEIVASFDAWSYT